MTAALTHRGPDAVGIHQDKGLVLGAARLAIIDLSQAANPPLRDETGEYTLVFNGEIYNYLELRHDLQQKGVVFKTQSDAEVLLRLFMQKQEACLADLRGMFAFAIWQKSTRRLFLARDRLGEKPLVYYQRNGLFIFASEIRAILTLGNIDRTIDPAGLHLGFHYVLPPAPYSAFKYIRKVPPGEWLTLSEKAMRRQRYFVPQPRMPEALSEDAAAERIRDQMDETVNLLCRSDVTVGATLSGGIDSSAVVASMARVKNGFDVFYLGCRDAGWDAEQIGAKMVAKRYGLRLHEVVVGAEMIDHLRDVVKAYAEPFSSFVPLHAHVLAAAMKGIATVILTGNGGDELFGGYPEHFTFLKYDRKLAMWDMLGKSGMDNALAHMPFKAIHASKTKYTKISRIQPAERAARILFRQLADALPGYYSSRMKEEIKNVDPGGPMADIYDACGAQSLADGYFCQQLAVLSQHSMVSIPDISGMCHSLEFRAPFLDKEMVAMAANLAWRHKINKKRKGAGGKWILRRAMENRLPEHVTGLDKFGFGASISYPKWFLGPWLPFIREILAGKALWDCGLFDRAAVLKILDQAAAGRKTHIEPLWGLVTLAIWLEEYAN